MFGKKEFPNLKVMVTRLKRYFKFLVLLTKLNYQKTLEYRLNFWAGILGPVFYTTGYLIYLNTLLSRTPTINGWSFDHMVLLFCCGQLFYYVAWIIYRGSLETFAYTVRDGSFDFALKTPINSRFNVSFREQRLNTVIPLLLNLGLFIYSLRNLAILPINIFLFLILFVCGLFIFYNFVFTLISFTFWVIDSDDLLWFGDDLVRYGAYPLEIYPKIFSLLLITALPVSLVIYVPATAIIGILNWKLGLMSVVMVFVSWFVSQKIWQAGLRRYSSASS